MLFRQEPNRFTDRLGHLFITIKLWNLYGFRDFALFILVNFSQIFQTEILKN